MPGRIANGIRQAGVKNPLMLLDEIDKVSTDYKGDTFSALLEVLDSEQNYKFRDHYLEVPLDLSEVLFIATANSLQTIPRPLLDRMEVIEVTSYTENEKLHIATEHLIPKQLEKNGLKKEQLKISKNAVWKIASNYTKEAGVRQLEREIGNICRKAAKEILTTGKKSVTITEKNLFKYLGKEKFTYQMANAADEIDCAWTGMDKCGWGYPPDRSECDAWKRRDHAHRSAWRCDERISTDRNQLYPFCQQRLSDCG